MYKAILSRKGASELTYICFRKPQTVLGSVRVPKNNKVVDYLEGYLIIQTRDKLINVKLHSREKSNEKWLWTKWKKVKFTGGVIDEYLVWELKIET